MTTLDFIKNELSVKFAKRCPNAETSVEFGELTCSMFEGSTLDFSFDDGQYFLNGKKHGRKGIGVQFTCSYKTPKGYISSKKLPVIIKDKYNLTMEEVLELLKFNTDAVKNTFDPFWHENQAKRKNAIAMNYIATNHLSEYDKF
tara:strand:+ start:109 stop:540 length:432 start_codon:yes stop_codon:yes gene_type:complete